MQRLPADPEEDPRSPTERSGARTLDDDAFVRQKLFGDDRSEVRRYAELVIGRYALWPLLRYELLTTLLGPLPGALGLFLRKLFYPGLFRRAGDGVVFGRDLVIRNPDRIDLGDRVVVDDGCVIDSRGGGDVGVRVGDEVIINRGAAVQAKVGPIRIGSHSDIGAGSTLISQGGLEVGRMVSFAANCKIGGGLIRVDRGAGGTDGEGDPNSFTTRGQKRVSKGPVRIGDRCVFGGGAVVLDGVEIGPDCIVGAGVVVRESVPAGSVVMPRGEPLVVPRAQFESRDARPGDDAGRGAPSRRGADPSGTAVVHEGGDGAGSVGDPRGIVFRALDQLNEQLPANRRIAHRLDAPLAEPEGPLDSLGVVNLVVAVEEALSSETGREVSIVDPSRVSSGEGLPFSTVGALVDHVGSIVERSDHG